MAKTEQKLDWTEIDPETLPGEILALYTEYKDWRKKANDAKAEFENAVRAQTKLPAGKRLVFGYNFGKLSAAIADDDAPKTKTKPAGTLADFVKAQTAGGRRA